MLTIFSIPKPFQGHIGIIQRNAIQSWLKLNPKCEIILYGNEEGISEIAAEYGIRYMPDVQKNEYGTPLLNYVFENVQENAKNDLVCYINTDIIINSSFLSGVKLIDFKKFLMIGQRWDVNIDKNLDFKDNNWDEKLMKYVEENGTLHPPSGSDYFVFPKGVLGQMPPFAVGRPGWDNWVIYQARKLNIPVINATQIVTILHQNHNYDHVPKRTGESWEGSEADRNRELIGRSDYIFTLIDANWVLTSDGPKKPTLTKQRLDIIIKTLPGMHPRLHIVALIYQILVKCLQKKGIKKVD